MITRLKQTGFALLLLLLLAPALAAQTQAPPSDTTFVFRFVPQKEMFFVPYRGNGDALRRLCTLLRAHHHRLRAGQMYISVSSHAATTATGTPADAASRLASLRSRRVKSALIQYAGVSEQMFVTDRLTPTAYPDSLTDVVVVLFPAAVEKVERIAGAQAAETVRSYLKEVQADANANATDMAAATATATVTGTADTPGHAERSEASALAPTGREEILHSVQNDNTSVQNDNTPVQNNNTPVQNNNTSATPYALALRANLLRWATLTPHLGMEWRINRQWGILVDGAWTAWSWNNRHRRYALWSVSPALHHYIGKEKRAYLGAMYHTGEFNYKLSATGKQGSYHGGGITGGYTLPIGKCLLLDFNLGVGYTRAEYEKYTVVDGIRVRRGNEVKNYWGINKAGVTMVFLIEN